MTDDSDRFQLLNDFITAVWDELPEGSHDDRTLPGIPHMAAVQPTVDIQMAPAISIGRWAQ